MKVYIVEAMSAESYEDNTWIVKVFDSLEKAEEYKHCMLNKEQGLVEWDQHIYLISEQVVE